MTTIRHLRFLGSSKFTASTLRRANMRHQAKFRVDQSNRCGDMAVWLESVLYF